MSVIKWIRAKSNTMTDGSRHGGHGATTCRILIVQSAMRMRPQSNTASCAGGYKDFKETTKEEYRNIINNFKQNPYVISPKLNLRAYISMVQQT